MARKELKQTVWAYLSALIVKNAVTDGTISLDKVVAHHQKQLEDMVLVTSTSASSEYLAKLFGHDNAEALGQIKNDTSRTACNFGLRVSFSDLKTEQILAVPEQATE